MTFKDLNLLPEIQAALDDLGFTEPTEIQKKAIPLLLESKKIDFHGQAQTGTGKTLAFGIPLLQRLDLTKRVPQALIVAPTRELAVQTFESLSIAGKKLGVKIGLIYGGVSMDEQLRVLKQGVHIVVGTPGRLNDHLRRKSLALSNIRTLVLDEADIMLDMGFKEEIDEILNSTPKNREIWLFSATVKSGINDIMKSHMADTVSVRVSQKQIGVQKTKQYYCVIPFRSRLHAITRFIQATPDFYGFIFCQTKILASEVAEQLTKRGYNVGALHGDMSQAQRNIMIKKFKQQEFTILVATDVAARGIDVANLTHVINYSIPEDLESYVHRVGRTGRAGKEGTAITFISRSEHKMIQQIERKFNLVISPIEVPSRQQLVDARLVEISAYITAETIENTDKSKKLYISALDKLLSEINKEKLYQITSQLLYDKFLGTLDLEEIPNSTVVPGSEEQLQELYINLGMDDGVTKDDIAKFLADTGLINLDSVRTIRVIKHRSFIKMASDCSPELLNALRNQTLNGRKVAVNLTCIVNEGAGYNNSGRTSSNNRPSGRPRRSGGDRFGRPERSGRQNRTRSSY